MRPGIPTHGEDRSAQRPVRSGEAHPLLAAFPLTVMALAIVGQALLRAVLTYSYNLTTARLTLIARR